MQPPLPALLDLSCQKGTLHTTVSVEEKGAPPHSSSSSANLTSSSLSKPFFCHPNVSSGYTCCWTGGSAVPGCLSHIVPSVCQKPASHPYPALTPLTPGLPQEAASFQKDSQAAQGRLGTPVAQGPGFCSVAHNRAVRFARAGTAPRCLWSVLIGDVGGRGAVTAIRSFHPARGWFGAGSGLERRLRAAGCEWLF